LAPRYRWLQNGSNAALHASNVGEGSRQSNLSDGLCARLFA
jgi:hypothetical protein